MTAWSITKTQRCRHGDFRSNLLKFFKCQLSLFFSLFPCDCFIYTEASFNVIRLIASSWLHTYAVIVLIGRLERNLIEIMRNELLPKKRPIILFFCQTLQNKCLKLKENESHKQTYKVSVHTPE